MEKYACIYHTQNVCQQVNKIQGCNDTLKYCYYNIGILSATIQYNTYLYGAVQIQLNAHEVSTACAS